MKKNKIIFWVATGLLSALVLMSAGMYVFNNAEIQKAFVGFGFPTFIIYPLAFLKLSGVLVITLTEWDTVKEWAYAGFFFNFILALGAHLSIGDGEQTGAIIALVLLITSYVFRKKLV
jgi:hypothetical protein